MPALALDLSVSRKRKARLPHVQPLRFRDLLTPVALLSFTQLRARLPSSFVTTVHTGPAPYHDIYCTMGVYDMTPSLLRLKRAAPQAPAARNGASWNSCSPDYDTLKILLKYYNYPSRARTSKVDNYGARDRCPNFHRTHGVLTRHLVPTGEFLVVVGDIHGHLTKAEPATPIYDLSHLFRDLQHPFTITPQPISQPHLAAI